MTYKYPRFLRIPELGRGERFKLHSVISNPLFKHGPLLVWQSSGGRAVMVNRQLFRTEMLGRLVER